MTRRQRDPVKKSGPMDLPKLSGAVEWVGADTPSARGAWVLIRSGYHGQFNAGASRLAILTFGMDGPDPMPSRLYAGWMGNQLVLSANGQAGTALDCTWTGGRTPRLAMGLARALQKKNINIPEGFSYRVAVQAAHHEQHGPVLLVNFDQVEIVPVDRRGDERDEGGQAAGANQAAAGGRQPATTSQQMAAAARQVAQVAAAQEPVVPGQAAAADNGEETGATPGA